MPSGLEKLFQRLAGVTIHPPLVTCHTPSIVGVWFSPGPLRTAKVLAATARVINAICVLCFILNPFGDWTSLIRPSLLLVIEVPFSCLSVSRHDLKDGFLAKGDENLSVSFPMVDE